MKIRPDRKEYLQNVKPGMRVPFYCQIENDSMTSTQIYKYLNKNTISFILESGARGGREGRYAYIGIKPKKEYRIYGDHMVVKDIDSGIIERKDPLNTLYKELKERKTFKVKGLPPFSGGMVGYLGYEMVDSFNLSPHPICSRTNTGGGDNGVRRTSIMDNFPSAVFLKTDTLLSFDYPENKIYVINNHIASHDLKKSYIEGVDELMEIKEKIDSIQSHHSEDLSSFRNPDRAEQVELDFHSNYSQDEFESAVKKAKEYIESGDVLQVVLSQALISELAGSPINLYRALEIINPSPYMYYLDFGSEKIVGSSPELLVKTDGNKVQTRPLAGTRPRGENQYEDKFLEIELLADEKEQAEHIMLVDLGRNDLGRICKYGTVEVTEFLGVERYSNVMHLVSNIEGKLKTNLTPFEIISSCFPAGTVSGAPKIRAMEIIEELEPDPRGPYAGAVGYISYTGDLDMCIAIRTMFISGIMAVVQAGAGIVADSRPENEYKETLHKASALLKTAASVKGCDEYASID